MAAATADSLTPAILRYVDHGAFPQDEIIASTSLTSIPSTLSALHSALQHERDSVEDEIRNVSRDVAGDVDTWIQRAEALRSDILKSRELARGVVEAAEEGRVLRDRREDKRRQVGLLEGEVAFQEEVVRRLEAVRDIDARVRKARDSLVGEHIDDALSELQEAEIGIEQLGDAEVGVSAVLGTKIESLKEELKGRVLEKWEQNATVDVEGRTIGVNSEAREVVSAAKGIGMFEDMIRKMSRDVDRAITRPRLVLGRDGKVPKISVNGRQLQCEQLASGSDTSTAALMEDLATIVNFLADQLPAEVALALSEHLIPLLTSRLEEDWLEPAVPLDISDMPEFQQLLAKVSAFAERIETLGWHGGKTLRDWVQAAPRIWLTKRREGLLGQARNLVFTGLRETKTVERIETQMVSKDDALGGEGGEDDWDTAWDEPEATAVVPEATEDEDMSAWDEEDGADPPKEQTEDAGEEDAWGWGGEGEEASAQSKPASPNAVKTSQTNHVNSSTKPAEREMTLRETFTVTAIPDSILSLVQEVIKDAGTLAGPEYSSSPIAPASTVLYTLPTLSLAVYRATAPTAYAKLPTGNMLIYNDALRLAEQLRTWQTGQPSTSRLRLDNDVKALEQFAKRSYSTEMESQRTILRDLLDGAQGFSSSSEQPFKSECESAIEQTVLRLKDVYTLWKPILSNSALLQSVGSLLASTLQKVLTEISDLPDISESDSTTLKQLFDDLSSSVRDLFAQPAPDGTSRDMAFVYCPNWLKFQYLAEIMVSSLADIKYLWLEGELSLEFEAEEVVGLVEALFAESTLRRSAIAEIRRGRR